MRSIKRLYDKDDFKSSLQADLSAGLVVFLVAVPLCLGIALASGAPMMSGIIAGLIGGIIVGIFGGSSLGVSGPAAGLVAIVIAGIVALGSFEAFMLATAIAGVMQILLGLARAGKLAYYIPTVVIKGMLAAIGLIIILKQIPHAVGYDLAPEGELGFESTDGHNTLSELSYMLTGIQPGAVIITVVGLIILIGWNLPALNKFKLFKAIPGPLVAVIAGVLLQLSFSKFFPSLAVGAEHLVQLKTEASISELIVFPDFSAISNPDVWIYAVIIALVASVESLLCAEATDKLDPQKRITPMNKELRAQGIANIVSGLIGGLPITQVIVRSSANVQSGGKTRISAIFHGLLILVSVLIFPFVLNLIPLASLAAILLVVGFKLTSPSLYKLVYKKGWSQFIPFLVTIVAILFTDLLTGIGIGMAVAIFFILRNNYRIPFFFDFQNQDGRPHIRLALPEIVSFLNKGQILATLISIPDKAVLEIDGTRTQSMDPDVMEVLDDFKENAKFREITVIVQGLDRQTSQIQGRPAAKELKTILNNHAEVDNSKGGPEKTSTPKPASEKSMEF